MTKTREEEEEICSCCNRPLNELIYEAKYPELTEFYNQPVPDTSKPGFFSHRLCWITTIEATFKAVSK